ncbi:hypothetical protein [Bradyrhizobium sp. B117]|uniref:hypothetical protein n=1 Tax=Bradyrhizobium sp. B117 TaxID=3140246 RepID=UPI003182EC43
MDKADVGVITIAIGHERYLRQAEILASSLRRNMPNLPFAIVTDSQRFEATAEFVIPPLADVPVGVVQKVHLDRYTPFKQTLFIDSDCIVTRPFWEELEQIRRFEFTPALERWTPADGHDEYLEDLSATLKMIGGSKFPKFNGGIYFFRNGHLSNDIFEGAREIHRDYRDYGIKAFDNSGPGEETVLALALAKLGVDDLYSDEGRLMRTPTGLKGKIAINPLGGGCTFERYDGLVSPAICHFAGPYLFSPEYRLAAYSLASNVPPDQIGPRIQAAAHVAAALERTQKFVRDKVRGAKKRMGYNTVR